jgi:predicted  nucleic acid-binding Zn-ribbon protein
MSAIVVTPMATIKGQADKMVEDVRKDISDLKDKIMPALAVVGEQVKQLQSSLIDTCAEMRDKASKPEVASLKAIVDIELGRLRQEWIGAQTNQGNMLDSHDERLREIENSHSEIKGILRELTTTVTKLDKSVTWITGKIWWILGGAAALITILQVLLKAA